MVKSHDHRAPEACHSISELRAEIDRLDREIVSLIAQRARYIDRAIVLKARDGLPAYVPERVDAVIANVLDAAGATGAPKQVVETVWRVMVDQFIAIEAEQLSTSAMFRHAPPG